MSQRTADAEIKKNENITTIHIGGRWLINTSGGLSEHICSQLSAQPVSVNAVDLADWDSSLVSFLLQVRETCRRRNLEFSHNGFPDGVKRLLDLATAVDKREGAERSNQQPWFVTRIGMAATEVANDLTGIITFTGRIAIASAKLAIGRARFRFSDLLLFFRQSGPEAIGIVTLISFLVGLIIAFVGAIQLQMFGAEIYVANLVGIGMVRQLAAIMTAIVMAGRTGAAYAAQLGTMQVNQEIDAFRTMGVSPIEFLVLPRVYALVISMPLLCIYADIMGLLGGAFVGIGVLRIGAAQYWNQTLQSIRMADFLIGIIMSIICGFVVSCAGCMRGLNSGRDSAAVGKATTSAVITSIVCIVLVTTLITLVCHFLGV
jgi:phospholipid/cholesterol/gamma-HCH transport system permease protein